MELLALCINVLLLLAIWKFCVQKTILDHHRDALFDLRDSVRTRYSAEAWDMNDPGYQHLRDLLNGSLRFIESYSLLSFAIVQSELRHNEELKTYLKQQLSEEFSSARSEPQRRFAKEVRVETRRVIQSYMVFSSGWLVVFVVSLVPLIALFQFVRLARRSFSAALRLASKKLAHVSDTFLGLQHDAISKIAPRVASPDLVEEYSYHLGYRS